MENMTLRLSGIVGDSIVDGKGIRMTVFTQGCPHHCPGCHNPHTHDFKGGYDETLESVLNKFLSDPLQCGVTLSGGEPFCQAKALAELCREVHRHNKNVWAYSGYTFEEIFEGKVPHGMELLEQVDVLVDGRFVLEERDLNLLFRGSRNQRLIDVKASFAAEKAVELAL